MQDESWYSSAQEDLARLAQQVRERQPLDLDGISSVAHTLVECLRNGDRLIVVALSGPAGSPLLTNLLNVGILATKIGTGLGYHGRDLDRLALAALLHDIGIFSLPEHTLMKSGPLTREERDLVETHPRLGADCIARAGDSYRWLAEPIAHAHERWTGQGYPNKLKGREINELAQIIGLVDVFDALVSPRPYRRRLLPHEAVQELLVQERTAFPREVMKALVEQISLYPLGTTVRVNTGEQGQVIRINPTYPSRPVLALERDRTLDLSTTPLVWVTEALAPPALDCLMPTAAKPSGTGVTAVLHSTDRFAALLETLDSIAQTIQSAVESRPSGSKQAATRQLPLRGDAGDHRTDVPIDTEILGLFALEAREWLRQMQVALAALDQPVEPSHQAMLLNIILQGMTHLTASASTVPLPAIERMAVDLIPLLQSAGREGRLTAARQLHALRDGLLRLAAVVQQLPYEPPGERSVAIDAGPRVKGQGTHPRSSKPSAEGQVGSMLGALRRLHEARSRTVQPMRDVLDEVIRRSEKLEAENRPIDAGTLAQTLRELDALDDQFLAYMTDRIPALMNTMGELSEHLDHRALFSQAFERLLGEVDGVRRWSERVHATTIAFFLQGLRNFLLTALRSNRPTLVRRLDAARRRLGALLPLATQWVEMGRIERRTLRDILPWK